jgi:peptidoglycan/LPS O-acetylase OafA/YrhL
MASSIHPKYRADIDGLRAIAILSVVIFHAFPNALPGGFIGVDIFFVISGFLISSIIFANLEQNSFSLADFYNRRIKRIFPALVLVLLSCYAAGWVLFFADEFDQLGWHMVGGASFVSNLMLWKESGYFDSVAEKKPLMHLWSLAIEEQFYIIWPLLMALVWKRKWNFLLLTAIVAIVSFGFNIHYIGQHNTTAAFYSPASRFWELTIGGVLAYLSLHRPQWLGQRHHQASVLGFALLAAGLIFIDRDRDFPGAWALLPTLGAFFLIAAGPQGVLNQHLLSQRLMTWFGLISYPLYLWHWPILSLARIVHAEPLPAPARAGAMVLATALAWLTVKLVEKPLRFGQHGRAKTTALAALMVVVAALGALAHVTGGLRSRSLPARHPLLTQRVDPSSAHAPACQRDIFLKPCEDTGRPFTTMIMGDSHGNHLYDGLAEATHDTTVAATTCMPLVGIYMQTTRHQAHNVCARNDYLARSLDALKQTPSIDTVVLSGYWRRVLDPHFQSEREHELWGEFSLTSTINSEASLSPDDKIIRGLQRTLDQLTALHKRIVFVRSNPDIAQDFSDHCLKREPILAGGVIADCTVPRAQALALREREDRIVATLLKQYPALIAYDPIDDLCDAQHCYLIKDGTPWYGDAHHLSKYGSARVGQGIVRTLNAVPRVFGLSHVSPLHSAQ